MSFTDGKEGCLRLESLSHRVCEKTEVFVIMTADGCLPENHDDQRVMRASLARNMSRVNGFKWIKCCEPISINND